MELKCQGLVDEHSDISLRIWVEGMDSKSSWDLVVWWKERVRVFLLRVFTLVGCCERQFVRDILAAGLYYCGYSTL